MNSSIILCKICKKIRSYIYNILFLFDDKRDRTASLEINQHKREKKESACVTKEKQRRIGIYTDRFSYKQKMNVTIDLFLRTTLSSWTFIWF
jgi:hypothetical protein